MTAHDRTDPRVEATLTRLLYGQATAGSVGGLIADFFVLWVLWGLVPAAFLVPWVLAMVGINLLRLVIALRFRRVEGALGPDEVARWRRAWIVLLMLIGVLAGGGGAVAMSFLGIIEQWFVMAVVVGVAAGNLATSGAVLPAFIGFQAALILPPAVLLIVAGGSLSPGLGVMMILLVVVLAATGRRYHDTLADSIALRYTNEDLVRDLREAKESAEAATRAKTAFLTNMSHELRTPLNATVGMSSVLLGSDLAPEQQEQVESIRASAGALLDIIEDLLDISRIERGTLELVHRPFNLPELLDDVIRIVGAEAAHKGIALYYLIGPGVPGRVVADPGRLRQILVNLAGNAVKFTQEGRVAVRVRRADRERLEIEVEDTGVGVAPEEQEAIFERFVQADASPSRQHGGTGLGLAIVRQLTRLMGGEITLESQPGRGSTFRFQAILHDAGEAPERAPLAGLTVATMAAPGEQGLALAGMLRRAGAEARVWAGREESEGLGDVAAIIIDERAAGGHATAERLATASSGVPVVWLGRDAPGGVVHSLSKPLWGSRLVRLLRSVAVPPATSAPGERAGAGGARVLLVEDNPINQQVGVQLLQHLGYHVDVAASGREALASTARGTYDLILMDCQMPEMDGYEATAAIRGREGTRRHTPVVALTANVVKGERERCLAAGMDDYIAKPVTLDSLRDVLSRWLQ